MDEVKIIEIKKSVFSENEIKADELREILKKKKTFLLNLMSSPGAGKTTTLIKLINTIKEKSAYKVVVVEADIDSDVDAKKIKEGAGIEAIQLHTGGMCHLDAEMTKQGLDNIDCEDADLVILENVGNLVCPAEFDTGAHLCAMILSVPEGHDKPLKYPLMFEICDLVIINKIDCLPFFDFNMAKCEEYVHFRNENAKIIPICAKTGEGVDVLAEYLIGKLEEFKN